MVTKTHVNQGLQRIHIVSNNTYIVSFSNVILDIYISNVIEIKRVLLV